MAPSGLSCGLCWFVFVSLCGCGGLRRHYFLGCVLGCVYVFVCVSMCVWKWVEMFCFTSVHGVMLVFLGCGCGCMLGVFWVFTSWLFWGCFLLGVRGMSKF